VYDFGLQTKKVMKFKFENIIIWHKAIFIIARVNRKIFLLYA